MLAAGSNFELKLDTTPVNFEIKQAEQTITGDDFSARIGSTVDLSEKFNASGSSSYEITGANTTGSSVSGSTLTVGGTAGNFQLKVSAAAATNYKAVEKIVTVKGRFVKEPQKQSFADVPADAYYYGAVEWAAEQGVTGGVGGGLFGPGRPCTRAQIVTFLYRAAGAAARPSATWRRMPITWRR